MVNYTSTNYSGNVSDYAFEYAKDLFQDSSVFGVDWIFNIILTLFVLLIITREYDKWKYMAFPVATLWHIGGVTANVVWLTVLGMLFAISLFSRQLSGGIVRVRDRIGRQKRELGIMNRQLAKSELRRRNKDFLKKFSSDEKLLKVFKKRK